MRKSLNTSKEEPLAIEYPLTAPTNALHIKNDSPNVKKKVVPPILAVTNGDIQP